MSSFKLIDELINKLKEEKDIKLTKEDIIVLIKNKVNKLKIIDDEAALFIIAKELGVKLVDQPISDLKLNIIDLVNGLKNININCYVEDIDYMFYDCLDETKCYIKLKCSDDSGLINVNIRGKNARLLMDEGIYPGMQLTLRKCYVKNNDGLIELCLRKNGHIDINLTDIHKEVVIGTVNKIIEVKNKKKLIKSILTIRQFNSSNFIRLLLLGNSLKILSEIKCGHSIEAYGTYSYNGYFYVTRLSDLHILGYGNCFLNRYSNKSL
ncbi:MAG: hypothetical protein QXY40_04695 [Candidatus Methanomethylicia archaeon]